MAPCSSNTVSDGWTKVKSKKDRRAKSAKAQGRNEVNRSRSNGAPRPFGTNQPDCGNGLWEKVAEREAAEPQAPNNPPPVVWTADQWYAWVDQLAQQDMLSVMQGVHQNWKTFLKLLELETSRKITYSVVQIMRIFSQYERYHDVEKAIVGVLSRLDLSIVPEDCQNVDFFSNLCYVLCLTTDRGSTFLRNLVQKRRLILIAIGHVCAYLPNESEAAEFFLAKLQDADLTSCSGIGMDGRSHVSLSLPDSNQKHSGNNLKQSVKHEFVSKKGILLNQASHPALLKKGRTIKQGSHESDRETKQPEQRSLAKMKVTALKKTSLLHAALNHSYNKARAVDTEEFVKKLRSNWGPLEFPTYLQRVMSFLKDMNKRSSGSFLGSLCTEQFIQKVRECLQVSQLREMSITLSFFHNMTNFCKAVQVFTPNVFASHFADIVEAVLAADKEFPITTDKSFKKVLLDLKVMLFATKYVSDEPPPESYHEMSVVPTTEDIWCEKVFLRPNIVRGPYESEQDYLDTQFRLLREDFLKPLREGIAEARGRITVLGEESEKRYSSLRIYKGVNFMDNNDRRSPGSLKMSFDPTKRLNIDWRVSKRFMMGALLVISNDHFQTLQLARVSRRDVDSLRQGWILIEPLVNDETANEKLVRGSFVVGESTIFFEPYYHVLNALQNTDIDSFPLARYIVRADPSRELPNYLQVEESRRYQIQLGGPGSETTTLDVVNGEWPAPAEMGLNESQHEALIGALTQKVMLVQGPPGTGKTFLGLRIVSTLLKNPHAWRGVGSEASPILIVCYTNHALDQFLVGLLNSTGKDTIVRVGGRCKDERLLDCVLQKNEEALPPSLKAELRKRHEARDSAAADLQYIQETLEALVQSFGIVNCETFLAHGVMLKEQAEELGPDGSITSWLEVGLEDAPLTDDQRRFLKENAEWKSTYVTFEETFGHMNASIEELTRLVHAGHLQYEEMLDYCKLRFKYFDTEARQKESKQRPADKNIHELRADERWKLYRWWVSELYKTLLQRERICQKQLRDCNNRVKQVRMLKDRNLIASKLIVGMTTTKAASLQPLLQDLKPSIVVVEEAAEVLESHIIAALTPHVQHLILLGDHEQLRPSPADHTIATNFKLEVSLFERLCDNNMPRTALNVQHRMRPEIASLIDFIYPGLQNHSSVTEYPSVRGLADNVFFVNHSQREQQMDELMSYCNPHEARFLGALVTFLFYQGYEGYAITILTTYSGQLMYIKGLESEYPALRNVRLCNVDNFQGEECDIILLSLVRSNPSNFIGFLKTKNRVCVALSRAKHGMIIVGDLHSLTAKSETWRHVERALKSNNAVGPALKLRCTVHQDSTLKVKTADDFKRWSHGGCTERCSFRLPCGHLCPETCHRDGLNHVGVPCVEKCNRMICNESHTPIFCDKLCYESCGPCWADKYVQLKCGHTGKMPCGQDPESYSCTTLKTVELECGHPAKLECVKDPKTYKCRKKVERILELCGHKNIVTCYSNGECKFSCEAKLPCGHICAKNCHKFVDPHHQQYICKEQCRRDRPGCSIVTGKKHICTQKCNMECTSCDVPVTKPLPCGHSARLACSEPATEDCCKTLCRRTLPCGHRCRRLCGEECGGCDTMVEKVHPKCQHELTILCGEDPEESVCTRPCPRELPCQHKCRGFCGGKCPPCTAKVLKVLPLCQHDAEVPCSMDPAEVACEHKCAKPLPCGHPCRNKCGVQCPDQCGKSVKVASPCGHQVKVPCHEAGHSQYLMGRCKKLCSAKLACGHTCKGNCFECHQGRLHKACEEKCSRKLVCGHRCPEICGRPCLPCKETCPVKCSHIKCEHTCGLTCRQCSGKCELGKPVFKCDKKCRAMCSWDPTNDPCRFPIKKCGHDCIGFEGDPCPTLCRNCDESELRNPGTDERFVFLPDCGHTERAKDLEKCIYDRPTVVKQLSCPKCESPIINSSRYGTLTKRRLKHIVEIYNKELAYTEALKERMEKESGLLKELTEPGKKPKLQHFYSIPGSNPTWSLLRKVIDAMASEAPGKQRGQRPQALAATMRSLCTYAEVVRMLVGCLRSSEVTRGEREQVAIRVDAFAAALAARNFTSLCEQEVRDINAELLRLRRLQQLCALEAAIGLQSEVLQEDADYKQASDVLRFWGPYPHKTMDDGVMRAILRLGVTEKAASRQWLQSVAVPLSAAEGCWYTCPNGHVYPKTGMERRCLKCSPTR